MMNLPRPLIITAVFALFASCSGDDETVNVPGADPKNPSVFSPDVSSGTPVVLPPADGNGAKEEGETGAGGGGGGGGGGGNGGGQPGGVQITMARQQAWNFNQFRRLDLRAAGGQAPYAWEASGLPSGLLINGSSLEGKPQAVGKFAVDLKVKDAAQHEANISLEVTVHEEFTVAVSICEKGARRGSGRTATTPRSGRSRGVTISCRDVRLLSLAGLQTRIQLSDNQLIKFKITGHATRYTWRLEGAGVTFKGRGTTKRHVDILSSHKGVVLQQVKVTVQNDVGDQQQREFAELERPDPCKGGGRPIEISFPTVADPRVTSPKTQHTIGEWHDEIIRVKNAINPVLRVVSQTLYFGYDHPQCKHYYDTLGSQPDLNPTWTLTPLGTERQGSDSYHRFGLRGAFQYTRPLGPGDEACPYIEEIITIVASEQGCTEQRGVARARAFEIIYPEEEDEIRASLTFQSQDTDGSSHFFLRLLGEDRKNCVDSGARVCYGPVIYYDSNKLYLDKYGDSGSCGYGPDECKYDAAELESADQLILKPLQCIRTTCSHPIASTKQAELRFLATGSDIGEELNFWFYGLRLDGRYWHAVYGGESIETELGGSWGVLNIWKNIHWKKNPCPRSDPSKLCGEF